MRLQTKLKLLMFWMKYRKYLMPAAVVAVLLVGYFAFFHR